MCVSVFCVFWWDRAIAVGLHTCSCPACRRREYARSPLNSGQWCHNWERSEKRTSLIHTVMLWPPLLNSVSHQESDPPGSRDTSIHNHLVASLPLEEELPGGSVRQAGLVVPHQVSAHKPTVVPRVQRSVEEEGVILRSERQTQQRHQWFSFKKRESEYRSKKPENASQGAHMFSVKKQWAFCCIRFMLCLSQDLEGRSMCFLPNTRTVRPWCSSSETTASSWSRQTPPDLYTNTFCCRTSIHPLL